MKGKKIVGDRFSILPSSNKNLPLYTQWLKDPLILRGLQFEHELDEVAFKKWFKQGNQNNYVRFEIMEKSTKKFVGFAILHDIDSRVRSGKVAIFICDTVYRYRGFGSEILHLVCKYALNELKLHSVWCEVPSYNSACLKVFAKQGFTECGTRHHAGMLVDKDGVDKYYNLTTFELINNVY